jgi:hypothetical protein
MLDIAGSDGVELEGCQDTGWGGLTGCHGLLGDESVGWLAWPVLNRPWCASPRRSHLLGKARAMDYEVIRTRLLMLRSQNGVNARS